MPLMFIALFYRMSAGLTLYWTVSESLEHCADEADQNWRTRPSPAAPGPVKKMK